MVVAVIVQCACPVPNEALLALLNRIVRVHKPMRSVLRGTREGCFIHNSFICMHPYLCVSGFISNIIEIAFFVLF